MHAATTAFAPVAATVPSSRAARLVRCAVTNGVRPIGSNIPRGGPKASAAAAEGRPAADHVAANALSSRPVAINRRMPPAAGAMPGGVPEGYVPTAVNPLMEHPGVSRARAAPMFAQASIAVSRVFHRATPSSKLRPAWTMVIWSRT